MRLLLIGLRLVVLGCVACMLLELVLVMTKKELVPSQMIVLVDNTESMGLKDPYPDKQFAERIVRELATSSTDAGVDELRKKTRIELAGRAVNDLLEPLAQDRQLSVYQFSNDVHPLDRKKLGSLDAKGTVSAVGDAVKNALAAHRGQPIAGVLIVTDAQSNSGEDPRKVAEQAGRDGVQISALAMGTEDGPANARMIEIEASPIVFLKDPAEINVLYDSRGLQGHNGLITVEQRRDGGIWTELGREEVAFGEDSVMGRLTFRFKPDNTGQYDFRAEITDAGPELTETDNTATRSVKVVRQHLRALLIGGYPSPEMQFLRNALLRDTALEFASWIQSAGPEYEQLGSKPIRRLPKDAQELAEQYDAVVLFDPDMRALGSKWSEILTKFVGTSGGGLIYVAGELHAQQLLAAGSDSMGPGGVDNSWLRVLPVVSESGLYQSSADVKISSREAWTLELTPEGDGDVIFRFADGHARNREVLTSLPGMFWHCPVTRAKRGATVLARHGDPRMTNSFGRHVLMATQLFGPGRTVFIGFDSTYRWRYLHEEYFDGFWARLIDRVGRSKALGGHYPFTLSTDKSAYRPGDRVTLRAEWLQHGDESPMVTDVSGELETSEGQIVPIEFQPVPDKEATLETSFAVESPGPYLVRVVPVSAGGEGNTGVRPVTMNFRVEPRSQELDRPTLDRALLDDMARSTGGRVMTLANYRQIPDAFKIKRVERVLEYRDELWDAPLLFGLLVVAITAEWVLRKRARMA